MTSVGVAPRESSLEATCVDWRSVPLRDLCTTISSGGTPSRGRPEYYENGQHIWIKSKELPDGSIYSSEERVTDQALSDSSAKLYQPNTVLVAMYGATVGKLGILKRQASINQAICALVIDSDLADFRYVFYTLLQSREKLKGKAFGAAQQNLNQGLIKDFEIPVPPLPTQRKIAAILYTYDDLIENNRRRIEIIEETAQLIYREWFVHFRFPGHEGVRMVDSPLGPIPEGWDAVTVGEIAGEVRRGIEPGDVDPQTPYVGLRHLPRKSVALSDWDVADNAGSTKLAFCAGEILFGKIRPYLHKVSVAPVDGICSTDTIVIKPKVPEWFSLVLATVSSEHFIEYATQTSQGTKMPRANWKVLAKYDVALPPLAVLSPFNDIVEDTVGLLRNIVLRGRILRVTRDLLLPRLISGEIDVSDLNIDTGELDQ